MAFVPLTPEEIVENQISGFNPASGFIKQANWVFQDKFFSGDATEQWYRFINTETGFEVYTVRTNTNIAGNITNAQYVLNKDV